MISCRAMRSPAQHAIGPSPGIADTGAAGHPTAMIDRPGTLLGWLFRRVFPDIVFPAELAARVRAAAARGTVVYVCPTLSSIDYVYFTYAFLLHGLPLARFANGMRTILLQPIGRLLRGAITLWRRRHESPVDELGKVVRRGESALLFLRRPRTLVGGEPAGFRGAFVEELIRIQRERSAAGGGRPILFVPLVLVWGSPAVRAARAKRGLIDIVFGEREAPGRLRALWMFFTHLRDAQVLGGEVLDLERFLVEEGGAADEVLARRLRWQLGGRLESEVRVVLGPARKGAARICQEILRSRKLVAEAKTIARDESIAEPVLERRARACLSEIAADPKPWAFGLLQWLLAQVMRRIFDGVEVDHAGLERVREAARRGPLVLVPSHKSHIDYLVLSDVCIRNDLVPPHIAAGANLSFFPLGFLFRRAGAFFLRRSMKGDRLYAAVFRAYVRKLLREGHNVEFFIEGGRSRTGKLLGPRLGLLGMIVEAALDDDGAQARRAQVVPISIGYEKVIEEKSYAHELAGGEKRAEDVRGLLRAAKVLGARYGQLNIQFDEPFTLGTALREAGALAAWDDKENVVVPASDDERRHAIERLGHRIVYQIDRVTAVTPTALAAAALLASGRRGVARRELLVEARFLLGHARAAGGRVSRTLDDGRGELDLDALDRALDLLAQSGDLEVRGGATGRRTPDEIYTVPDERRPRLAYYRNNLVHLFVSDGLVALALAGCGPTAPRHVVGARTLALSRLLKLEFSYRVGASFEAIFDETVAHMVAARLIAVERGEVTHDLRAAAPDKLRLLAGLVRDFVESYLIAARALEEPLGALPERELVRRIQDRGDRLFFTGEVRRREACVRASYQNAVECFRQRGVLVADGDRLRLSSTAEARRLSAEIAALLPPE
jgi:glycerol-3-phosphate O-acyltransferase